MKIKEDVKGRIRNRAGHIKMLANGRTPEEIDVILILWFLNANHNML